MSRSISEGKPVKVTVTVNKIGNVITEERDVKLIIGVGMYCCGGWDVGRQTQKDSGLV